METEKLRELHRICVTSLRDYIAEANRTCKLLESITDFPISVEVWKASVEQRSAENDAHERYMFARERLLSPLRPRTAER